MAIGDDFRIDLNGDIRYTGSGTNYTVIELHRWFGDLMDDAQASGNDFLDITSATASARSTDNIITLNNPYNIDFTASKHLYDGSIIQNNGAEIYDGIVCYAPASTYLTIIQNGLIFSPNFWTTGLNADAAQGISHRFMIRTRTGGADIDGRRLIGQTREFGKQYSEFRINGTARGNNVLALSSASDLNNQTAIATVAGYTDVVNIEGFRQLDVDNDTVNEDYYSEYDKGSRTINGLFERTKWLSRRATSRASNADVGSNFAVGNGTLQEQGQSYTSGANAELVTRVFFDLKKVGSPTGNLTAEIYAHTGTFGSTGTPTGATLGTSKTLDVSTLTTSYETVELGFDTQFEMAASTNYFVAVKYTGGDGSNYVDVRGLATSGTHAGNRADYNGTIWTAAASDDLNFNLHVSSKLYGITGELFRGITHEFDVDTPVGTFNAVEDVSWPTGSGQMLAIDSTTAPTKMWIQLLTGVAPGDNDVITGGQSSATCQIAVTVTERPLSFPYVGASTGSAIVGAYGIGIETADLTASDKLFDLTNTQRVPPNNVQISVSGLVASEDRVLVAPLGYFFAYDTESGGPFTLDENLTLTTPSATAKLTYLRDDGTTGYMVIRLLTGDVPIDNTSISGDSSSATALVSGTVRLTRDPRQLELQTTLSGATETAVVCTAAIPTDTPSSGTIRIELDSGIERRIAYTSYTGSTFTIASTDFSTDNATLGNGIYVSYIDKDAGAATESVTVVYGSDRNLFVRVRDGKPASPIQTFDSQISLTSTGGSAAAIRTPDE